MRAASRVAAMLVAIIATGCGSSTHVTPHPAAPKPTPVSQPQCGQYCQTAGESAGEATHGYPCPTPAPGKVTGCLQCPSQGCMTLLTSSATPTNGILRVRVSCNISGEPCVGAFLACDPGKFCYGNKPPGPQPAYGGRIAGSDFEVPSGQTATIAVAMTPLGNQVAVRPGGYKAAVYISLRNYGVGQPSTPGSSSVAPTANLQITSSG